MDQKVERLPAEARFPLTNKSAYYRVTVHYLNGTKTTVTSCCKRPGRRSGLELIPEQRLGRSLALLMRH